MKKIVMAAWALALSLLCALLPLSALAATAVSYVERSYSSESNLVTENTKTVSRYTEVKSTDTTWSGWMVASGDVTINQRVDVSGDTHLILTDGATLTVNGGISVNSSPLTIYGQANDSGVLIAGDSGKSSSIGISGYSDSECPIVIHGGTIRATGYSNTTDVSAGIGGTYDSPGYVIIYGGNIQSVSHGLGVAIGSRKEGSAVVIHGGVVQTFPKGNLSSFHISGKKITITGGLIDFGVNHASIVKYIFGSDVSITGGAFNVEIDTCSYTLTRNAYGGGLTVRYQGAEVGAGTMYANIAPGTRLNVQATSFDTEDKLVGLYLLKPGDPLPAENYAVDKSVFQEVWGGAGGYDFTMPASNATLYAIFESEKASIPTEYTLLQGDASGAEAILRSIQADLLKRDVFLEAKAIENLTLVPAVAGDKNNPNGTNGRFECTVVLTNGMQENEGRVKVTGEILAGPYLSAENLRVIIEPFGEQHIAGDLLAYGYALNDIATPLEEKMTARGISSTNTRLYDVRAEIFSGDGWSALPSALIPEQGIKVTQTLPNGVTNNTHSLFAVHMLSEDSGRYKAGEIETLTVSAVGDHQISYTLRGFSPVMIGWTEKAPSVQLPQTGDDSRPGLWLAVCLLSAAGILGIAARNKKKNNQ